MKRIFSTLILIGVCMNLPAVTEAQTRKEITVYSIRGPSAVALLSLFESPPQSDTYTVDVRVFPQADVLSALFISGEAKIGILPPNMAAKIAASGKKLQVAAVTGTGMLSLLSGDPAVRRIEDLKGKTVEVAGQGATPDFVFRKILQSKGMAPGKDITLGYALAYPEMALALAAGRIRYALLPEPFATMAMNANGKLTVVGDIQKEWEQITSDPGSTGITDAGNFPMTVLVVDADFARDNPNLVGAILTSIENSIQWVTSHPAEAGSLAEKYELGIPSNVVRDAIPRSNYTFIPLPQARAALEALFSVFLQYSPASIGGRLPSDSFYYNTR